MADAATTNRGLNDLLSAKTVDGSRMMATPSAHQGEQSIPIFGDISSKAMFSANAARSAAGKLTEANRGNKISLTGDSWVAIDWDPEVQAFDMWCQDTTAADAGVDCVEFTTDPAAAANAGLLLKKGVHKTLYVADAPLGRIYVRRTNVTNTGNGTATVTLYLLAYGSRNMLGASRNNTNTAHS